MNRTRRKRLEDAISLLNNAHENVDAARDIVENIKDEEQESFDNLPESMQYGERGSVMEENINELDDVYYELDSVYDTIEEQIDAIQNVINK